MPLTDDDVREILRIIDESDLDELRIETDGFSLHVRKGAGAAGLGGRGARGCTLAKMSFTEHLRSVHPRPSAGRTSPTPDTDGLETVASPMLGTFYRAEAPGGRAVRRGRSARSGPRRPCASSRS